MPGDAATRAGAFGRPDTVLNGLPLLGAVAQVAASALHACSRPLVPISNVACVGLLPSTDVVSAT
jgi:hypothetical protein